MRKLWLWGLAGIGVVALIGMALLVPGGFRAPVMGQSTGPWPVKITTTAAYEAQLRRFEQENTIQSSSWYQHVKGRDLQNSGASLWVYTDLGNDGAAKALATEIRGAYAKYEQVDAKVRTTVVRAGDTRQLVTCGPDA